MSAAKCNHPLWELAPWEMSFNGYRWFDMPGQGEDDQKLNFFLFRRGKLKLEEIKLEVEILGELPKEVTVCLGDSGWRLGKEAKVKKARAMVEGRRRKRLRVVRPKFGKIGSLLAGMAVRAARVVTPEQVALVAEYRELSGRMNRMDSPRAMMVRAVRELGGKEGAFLAGLEKGMAWSEAMVGFVGEAMPVLRGHVAVVEATLGRVRGLMAVYQEKTMPRGLWMVDLTRASGLSEQAVKDFLAGKLSTLRSLKMLEAGLRRLGCARGARVEGGAAL